MIYNYCIWVLKLILTFDVTISVETVAQNKKTVACSFYTQIYFIRTMYIHLYHFKKKTIDHVVSIGYQYF